MPARIQTLKKVRPKLRWMPRQGEQTTEFLERKRAEFRASGRSDGTPQVLLEAQTILGRCVPPTAQSGMDTGLVVGYVQSGKTLSFTTLMALARDNGYQFVIVIAGIATNLKSQNERRLLKDLGIEESKRAWVHFENPADERKDARAIQNALDMLRDPRVLPHKRRAVVVTVLKNHIRLQNLVSVVGQLKLAGVPTLVIDDEADQASLNLRARKNRLTGGKGKSANYDWITQLKAAIPHHTFLQYTATPQANLLSSIADVLSPSFAEPLTPGDGYVGGQQFFGGAHPLVVTIPAADIPTLDNPLSRPPASLLSALRHFLLGAAVHALAGQHGNRSMMIHPSQLTGPHGDYKSWVEKTIESWSQYLSQPASNPAYKACAKLFESEYKSLAITHRGLPPLKRLVETLKGVLYDTRAVEVNSTKQGEKDVKWSKNDYWILIGGQKLDRGFTVEGLTVTYMPRPIGTGNADTLQQRARFFGYKADYKGLCRVFLDSEVRDAFKKYVEHETFIRKALSDFRGRPLREWKRDFILTRMLSPTRAGVIGIETRRISLDEGWVAPGGLYKEVGAVRSNRQLFGKVQKDWARRHKLVDAGTIRQFKDRRAKSPRNWFFEGVPLSTILEDFLLDVRVPDLDDSETHTGVCMALRRYLEDHPKAMADVFLIGDMQTQQRDLDRQRINQVFQGKTPNINDFAKLIYVGDRALFTPGRLTLHLRKFSLKTVPPRPAESADIPWFALHVAESQVRDAVVQAEGQFRARKR